MPATKGWIVCGASAFALLFMSAHSTVAQFYDRVEVRGNQFLQEDEILTACGFSSDEKFNAQDVSFARDCLISTGKFSSVDLYPENGTMIVEVAEVNPRPGRIELGLKVDSDEGLLGSLYFERYNFFPKTFAAVELQFSDEFASLETNIFRTDLFGEGWDAGIDLLAVETEFDDRQFSTRRVTIEPFVARRFGRGRVEVGLGYRSDSVFDVDPAASALILADDGTERGVYLRFGYEFKEETWQVSATQHFFDLGQSAVISHSELEASSRVMLVPDSLDLNLRAAVGHVDSLSGRAPRITDRFFVGGANLRGFAPRGLGPRDGPDFLGGQKYVTASAELQQSIGDIFSAPARVGGFIDVGTTWDLSDTLGGTVDDDLNWRSSIGVSLTLQLGNVPLSMYVAKPIQKSSGDDEQTFGLSISTSF